MLAAASAGLLIVGADNDGVKLLAVVSESANPRLVVVDLIVKEELWLPVLVTTNSPDALTVPIVQLVNEAKV